MLYDTVKQQYIMKNYKTSYAQNFQCYGIF